MKTSESIKNLTKALLTAQTQMGAAVKGAKNPFFKSSYADLPTVMEVTKGPLNDNGILVLQPASNRDGKNFITTTLIHAETGEFITSDTEVVTSKQNDPQSFGAAQTYARRFGLQSLLFIPAEDDDGNFASGRTNTQPSSAQVRKEANVIKHEVSVPAAEASATPQTTMVTLENKLPPGGVQMEPFKKTGSFSKKKPVPAAVVQAAAIPAATPTGKEEW